MPRSALSRIGLKEKLLVEDSVKSQKEGPYFPHNHSQVGIREMKMLKPRNILFQVGGSGPPSASAVNLRIFVGWGRKQETGSAKE